MLVVRYSKSGGAEFISHLDTLRHLQKTIIRSGIAVEYSKGFNPHMLLFLSSPIAAGLISYAEYFFLETSEPAESFKEKFNRNCPKGFECLVAKEVTKNPNLAAVIDGARYEVQGVPEGFDPDKILKAEEYFITDKRGERKNVRDKIKNIVVDGDKLICYLASGNSPLRVDLLTDELVKEYGFEFGDTVKTDSYIKWEVVENVV